MSNYARATELNKIGKWEQALPFAERAVADDSRSFRNWCLLGWTLNELGRYRDGLAAAEEALRLSPDSEWAHRTRSTALEGLGRRPDALAAAREAMRQAPDEWRAWNRLAVTAYRLGYSAEAREAAERAVELAPDLATTWVTLSYITLHEDWNEAAAAALRALRINPESAAALNNLGYARFLGGRYVEARDTFDRGIAVAPQWAKLLLNRAQATIQIDGLEVGAKEYARAETFALTLTEKRLAEDPTNILAHVSRANHLRRLYGDHAGSFDEARRAMTLDPRSPKGWGCLADAAKPLGRWRLARYAARRAVQAEPSVPGRWLYAAFTAQYAGVPEEARRWAQRVVDEAPESDDFIYASALLALLDGDPGTARDLGRENLERYGENCCHLMFIVNCSLELGDTEGAREALDRAEHWRPNCHCHARTRYERILATA